MERSQLRAFRAAGAFVLLTLLGAAGPANMKVMIGDLGPLAQPEPAPAKALTFQNSIYQAAPVPDPDAQGPRGTVRTDAEVGPRFLSATPLFQGDGYAYASSQQATLERRKAAAAGLGLSVPVDQ